MPSSMQDPLALVAELTHRCPLHCVYCSNPLELQPRTSELSTETWSRVFTEAAEAGVLQADFTGGEPLARPDIVNLVRSARAAGLYVSLITSGLPMDEAKLETLVQAGLDHFQMSFQGAREETANDISGTKSHQHKLRVLQWLKRYRIGITLNFVIHRRNIDELEEMLAIVEESGAGCVEFASVQYYGWAFANREKLLPTRQQLDYCVERLKHAEEELEGRTRILFVVPDYYAKFPKPCVGGWGRKLMLITPTGDALPCHAAPIIPGLKFENVKNRSLREIWEHSEAFQKFRGEDWMQERCKSCDRRAQDFGGCRCQAMLLAGDAAATDPVCSLAPQRPKVDAILAKIDDTRPAGAPPASAAPTVSINKIDWIYRPNPS
ncbi:MAG TPA: pyrroloquinoline quinone biosynthesis protein PqqE [Candidatus Acidoferrum sp.]